MTPRQLQELCGCILVINAFLTCAARAASGDPMTFPEYQEFMGIGAELLGKGPPVDKDAAKGLYVEATVRLAKMGGLAKAIDQNPFSALTSILKAQEKP